MVMLVMFCFFFSSRRRHTRWTGDWSSDVCSSDLVPPSQVGVVNGHKGTKVLESPSAAWTPICMRVDAAPFTDVRVRQAMRLIVDRPQMIQQALSGHGRIGNDLYAPFDENF